MTEVIYRRCCGMDVHRDTVVVSVLAPQGKECVLLRKTYRTLRNDLIRMRTWFAKLRASPVDSSVRKWTWLGPPEASSAGSRTVAVH
jgi:hypothetical protein